MSKCPPASNSDDLKFNKRNQIAQTKSAPDADLPFSKAKQAAASKTRAVSPKAVPPRSFSRKLDEAQPQRQEPRAGNLLDLLES